jgi:hypothetical protein
MVFGRDHVAPSGAFRGEKRVAPNHFFTPRKFGKVYTGHLSCILLLFQNIGPFET